LHEIKHVVFSFFTRREGNVLFYASDRHYHFLVAAAQQELRQRKIAERLTENIKDFLAPDHGLGPLYLRAERPNMEGQECVPFHREEFYGSPKGTMNFWLPIRGVTRENILRYVPDSEFIRDGEIKTERTVDPHITKGSAANEVGLLYAPKRIVSGVDLSSAVPMEIPEGSAALFSGSLIHGAPGNKEAEIRFSLDFRIWPRAKDWTNLYSQQDPNEIQWLQNRIRGAKSILEIGSCHGNSLRLFAQVAAPGAVIRSIDLGDGTDWRDGESTVHELQETIRDLKEEGFEAKALFNNSHSLEAIRWAQQWAPYDFVFIDAGHSYEDVKADWENYGPMGKVIAFHDICYEPREVRRLWAEIKDEFITDEIVASRMGIGLITQTAIEYRDGLC